MSKTGRPRRYTDEQLVEEIKQVSKLPGRSAFPLTAEEFEERGLISLSTIKRRFGTWG